MATFSPSQEPKPIGILVVGYNRPQHLKSVLLSLQKQQTTVPVHVWIDGTQSRKEFAGDNLKSLEVAREFDPYELRATDGHLGIEKLMLDALDYMSQHYRSVIVLEDDCFPRHNCIAAFQSTLSDIANRQDVYSAYGHHFGTEHPASQDFSRFQGWGWAAHSAQIRSLLPELMRLFMLSETDYLAEIQARMTPEIQARLDVTPGRNVLGVLERFYSWDSATTFLCAERSLLHRRTQDVCVVNTGIVPDTGHFHPGRDALRKPPFNMIELHEAWDNY